MYDYSKFLSMPESDWSDIMTHIQKMPLDFCNSVLLEILPRPECKDVHLEFLISKALKDRGIDVSMLSLNQLIKEKDITSASLLQRFLELGLPLSKEDIMMAMKTLKPNQMHLFKPIASKANPEDLHDLCQAALTSDRMLFVANLVEQGARIPGHGSEPLMQAVCNKDYNALIALAKCFPKDTLDKLGFIGFIIGKAMSLPRKIELLSVLLEKGADCNHLCEAGKASTSSTPLHVATELSLKAGKSFFTLQLGVKLGIDIGILGEAFLHPYPPLNTQNASISKEFVQENHFSFINSLIVCVDLLLYFLHRR